MATKLLIGKDINGTPSHDKFFSDYTVNFPLTANIPVVIGVPEGMSVVYFEFSKAADVWVSTAENTAIPSLNTFLLLENADNLLLEDGFNILLEGFGSASTINETLNPDARDITNIYQMSFVSATNCFVNLNFYTRSQIGVI